MTSHPSLAELSAYLDEELAASRLKDVERHLAHCQACRGELAGLRKVVSQLGRIERSAPPPALGLRLRRRLATEDRPVSLAERLDASFSRAPLDSSLLFTFALVLALAVMVYMFAHMFARESSLTPVQLESQGEGPVDQTHSFIWEGRSFVFVDPEWRDQECLGLEPQQVIVHGTAEWSNLIQDHPEMERLIEMAEPVVIDINGRILRLERQNTNSEFRVQNSE
jgi:hypothetical protein